MSSEKLVETLVLNPWTGVAEGAPEVAQVTLEEAFERLQDLVHRPFGEWMSEQAIENLTLGKGAAGRALEIALGGCPVEGNDFIDGELKTFRCDRDGYPIETVCVLQMGQHVDELLGGVELEESRLWDRLRRMLLVGIDRDHEDPSEWRIALAYRWLQDEASESRGRLETDWWTLVALARHWVNEEREFTTMNADILQIRVKDSRPYTPLFSPLVGRVLHNKNIGFYLRRSFLQELAEEHFWSVD